MIASKSDKLSLHYKTLGNKFYQKNRFTEALTEYNRALAYAESKENLSLAYANRSAVYFNENKYKKCMQNIQWALENDYPPEKIEKLIDRREKCENSLREKPMDSEEELKKMFELSYPSNPKIPFIIDGMEVRYNKKHGRGIFTTRDLKPGDIISIEKPIMTAFTTTIEKYSFCCNCTSSKDNNLLPCLKTASLMFCSIQCRDEVYEKFKLENFDCLISDTSEGLLARILYTYEDVFGGTDNLKKFIKENDFKKWKKTIFDYDLSDAYHADYKINAMKSILSYFTSLDYKANKKCNSDEAGSVTKDKILKDFLQHMSVVWGTKVMRITSAKDFTSHFRFHLFSPLVNHSCFPNIQRVITDSSVIFYVSRPIKAGDEILRNVSHQELLEQPTAARRQYLRLHNCIYCNCFYCEHELTSTALPCGQFPLPIDGYKKLNCDKEKIKTTKRNFKDIEEYEANFPMGTLESFLLSNVNNTLMNHLGGLLD